MTAEDRKPARAVRTLIRRRALRLLVAGALIGLITGLLPQSIAAAATGQTTPTGRRTVVFATGLDNPRGLTFGPGGQLYVAEGGKGGTNSTVGVCDQVPAPVGPYTGGFTARISK